MPASTTSTNDLVSTSLVAQHLFRASAGETFLFQPRFSDPLLTSINNLNTRETLLADAKRGPGYIFGYPGPETIRYVSLSPEHS